MEIKPFLISVEDKGATWCTVSLAEHNLIISGASPKIYDGVLFLNSVVASNPTYFDKMNNVVYSGNILEYTDNGIFFTTDNEGQEIFLSSYGATINASISRNKDLKEFRNKANDFFKYQTGKIELNDLSQEYFTDEEFVKAVKTELKSRVAAAIKNQQKFTAEDKKEVREYVKSQLKIISSKKKACALADLDKQNFKSKVFELIDGTDGVDTDGALY